MRKFVNQSGKMLFLTVIMAATVPPMVMMNVRRMCSLPPLEAEIQAELLKKGK